MTAPEVLTDWAFEPEPQPAPPRADELPEPPTAYGEQVPLPGSDLPKEA
jgi:hypothetical protein